QLRTLARIILPTATQIHPSQRRCSSVTARGGCALLAPPPTGRLHVELGNIILARVLRSRPRGSVLLQQPPDHESQLETLLVIETGIAGSLILPREIVHGRPLRPPGALG